MDGLYRNKNGLTIIYLFFFCLLIGGIPWAETAVTHEISPEQWVDKGEKFYHKGDFAHAAESWEQAINLLDPEKDGDIYIETLIYLANAYHALGHHTKALDIFEKVKPLICESCDTHRKALFFSSFGDLYLSLGNVKDALPCLEEGLENARLPSILNNMGNAQTIKGDGYIKTGAYLKAKSFYDKAKGHYEECLDLINQGHGPSLSKSKVLINLARVTSQMDNYQDTITAINKALQHIQSLSDSHNKGMHLISLSLLTQDIREKHPQSDDQLTRLNYQILNDAKQIGKNIGDARIASYAYGYLGQLYEEKEHYSEAIKLTRSAIFFAQQGHFPEILYLWQWQLGRLFKANSDIKEAVKAYKNAVYTLTPVVEDTEKDTGKDTKKDNEKDNEEDNETPCPPGILHELSKGYHSRKSIFYEKIKPVYLELAELLLKQADAAQNGDLKKKKLEETRDTMELLKTSELQDYFQDECVTIIQKKITKLEHASPGTAIIYPILLPDHPTILLILPNEMKQITLPVSSNRLKKTIRKFRMRLQKMRHGKKKVLSDGRRLYKWLIEPVEQELIAKEINVKTLIIAPDGLLRLIPFSALHDGSQFLIEKYAIVTIPAMTLTDSKPIEPGNAQILLSGLSKARHGFPALPSVVKELKNIEVITGGRMLLDEKYTLKNLQDEFKRHEYSIALMSTHGVFGGTLEETFLLTYDSKMTMKNLEELIGIGRYREKQLELLTLSACQTAMGDERAALGLAGVAVKAGARSALATLWSVSDESTSVAITEFYRQLSTPGTSKAKALQNAQKKLIARPEYQHPFHWAPFLLIGNWL